MEGREAEALWESVLPELQELCAILQSAIKHFGDDDKVNNFVRKLGMVGQCV